ncbi:MAG TPA: HAD family phosphatase [Acholeplasmataceae bacterium]|nr:HAD family phosphatase [Acholeplasmataceae bacterium]
MIKLIGIDMDGTLLDKDKLVSRENIEAINLATKQGITSVIATGRPLCKTMIDYYKLIGLTEKGNFLVACNGALVYDMESYEIISSKYITGKDVKKINKFIKLFPNVNSHVYQHEEELKVKYEKLTKYTALEETVNEIKLEQCSYNDFNDNDEIVKYMAVGEKEYLDEVVKMIPSDLQLDYNILRSETFFLEFVHKEVNKYYGLKTVASILKIDEKEIMAIGDALNDLHMIEDAEIGVAMSNATSKIKEVAKYITKSNNESGVAYAIKKWAIK